MLDTFYKNPFPVLNINQQYALREQHINDAKPFYIYYSNSNVNQHILATPPTDLEDAKSEIRYCRNLFYNRRGVYWSLVRRDRNEIIGTVGLYINNHHQRGEICYDLAEPYWRKGIMTQALITAIDFAFETLKLNRIEAITLAENAASQEILKKIGFIHEGCLHNYRFYQNAAYDVELLAATPEMIAAKKQQKLMAEQALPA